MLLGGSDGIGGAGLVGVGSWLCPPSEMFAISARTLLRLSPDRRLGRYLRGSLAWQGERVLGD
jgi:hypothetical protein